MQKKSEEYLNKFTAIILIMVLTLADIIAIGLEFASFAIDMVATSSNNIEFSAYFKEENGEEVTITEYELNAERLNMYIDISVLREGYFNGKIVLEDSNFSIVEVTENAFVSGFEGNTISLNQINSGKTVTLEVIIKPETSSSMKPEMLIKDTKVKLEGTYTSSKGESKTEGLATVTAKFVTPQNAESLLDAQILTNKIYTIDSKNKRVLQILVRSKIQNNIYPAKTSNLEVILPKDAENIQVISRSTNATNKNITFGEENFKYNKGTSKLQIELKNEKDENGNISFEQNAKDEFVITCIYAEDKEFEDTKEQQAETSEKMQAGEDDLQEAQIMLLQKILTYDDKTLENSKQLTIDGEIDGIINYEISKQENTIYKGKIYASEEREYKINVRSYINSTDAYRNIDFVLDKTNYLAGDVAKESKIQYKEITITKEDFEKIIGEEGYINLTSKDGSKIASITKDADIDENGNIVIKLPESTYEVAIQSSKVVSAGKIDFKVTKCIVEEEYTDEQIKTFTALENGITESGKRITNNTVLGETITKANFEINEQNLYAGENNDIQMKITLLTENESRDLYKNPTLKLIFPEKATEVTAKYKILYGNGLEIKNSTLKEENGRRILYINLEGEQVKYSGKAIDGVVVLVNADIVMDEIVSTREDCFVLEYVNEKANGYYDDVAEAGYANNIADADGDLGYKKQINGVIVKELSTVQKTKYTQSNNIEELETKTAEIKKQNAVEENDFEIELSAFVVDDGDTISSKKTYRYAMNIKNNTSKDMEDLQARIVVNELLQIQEVYYENVTEDSIIIIDKLNAGEEESIVFYVKCLEKKEKDDHATLYAELKANGQKYVSNKITHNIEDISGNMEISSTTSSNEEERIVKPGDYIEYTIKVKNTGMDSINKLNIISELSECLEIEKITIDETETNYEIKDTTSKNDQKIVISTELEPGREKIINIKTKIKPRLYEDSVILYASVEMSYNMKIMKTKTYEEYHIIGSKIKESTTDNLNDKNDLKNSLNYIDTKTKDENDMIDKNKVLDENTTDTEEMKNDENNKIIDSDNNRNEGDNSYYNITGTVWLDEENNGKKLINSKKLDKVKIRLIDATTGGEVDDKDGNKIISETDTNGMYKLSNIERGSYMVIFEYDTSRYKPTAYQKEGVDEVDNSDAILKELVVNGNSTVIAATDIININKDIQNVDLGLIEIKKLDLELIKTVSKITVINNNEEKEYNFGDSKLAKVEIPSKQLNGSKVLIEYKIKVKNQGEISGVIKNIVDYMPEELEFNSALNENWYKREHNLYNTILANEEIKPGETKEIKLILTKNMTDSNTGLISNNAEISEMDAFSSNSNIEFNINNNETKEERKADVIIGIKTGKIMKYTLFIIILLVFIGTGVYTIKRKNSNV